MSSAGNQQERLVDGAVSFELASLFAGFAMGEGSFMIVCRKPSPPKSPRWRISAAFNVSQKDREPLDVLQAILGCGEIRLGGNSGWYFEVRRLSDLRDIIIPFFERFPLIGTKADDFAHFRDAVSILSSRQWRTPPTAAEAIRVLTFRDQMNRGGKNRHATASILRDYTPGPIAT